MNRIIQAKEWLKENPARNISIVTALLMSGMALLWLLAYALGKIAPYIALAFFLYWLLRPTEILAPVVYYTPQTMQEPQTKETVESYAWRWVYQVLLGVAMKNKGIRTPYDIRLLINGSKSKVQYNEGYIALLFAAEKMPEAVQQYSSEAREMLLLQLQDYNDLMARTIGCYPFARFSIASDEVTEYLVQGVFIVTVIEQLIAKGVEVPSMVKRGQMPSGLRKDMVF